MECLLSPNTLLGWKIGQASNSSSNQCWTCGSCDFECPVNLATGRLRPQKIVRMANLGFIDELLHLPEIWYCLTCRRCMNVCPNAVSPSMLIEFVRREALLKGIVSMDALRLYQDLYTCFQRVRWHVINHCFKEDLKVLTDQMWYDWLEQPVNCSSSLIKLSELSRISEDVEVMIAKSRTLACFTCGECSSACPVVCEGSVFDPRVLFRMINLGMIGELIRSPSIWLCIDCGRCTESCSQLVDGRRIIAQIKDLAIKRGVVDIDFRSRLEQADKKIFKRFLNEIDLLFEL